MNINVQGQHSTFSHPTGLDVLRPFFPVQCLLQKQPKCPYLNTKDTARLQIISLSNNTENMAQAATRGLFQTSSVGRMVLSTGEGREDETGQTPGFRGAAETHLELQGRMRSFGLCLKEDETKTKSFCPSHNPCTFSPVL